jgi:hypothetical protein
MRNGENDGAPAKNRTSKRNPRIEIGQFGYACTITSGAEKLAGTSEKSRTGVFEEESFSTHTALEPATDLNSAV